jgi:hypothetical protein
MDTRSGADQSAGPYVSTGRLQPPRSGAGLGEVEVHPNRHPAVDDLSVRSSLARVGAPAGQGHVDLSRGLSTARRHALYETVPVLRREGHRGREGTGGAGHRTGRDVGRGDGCSRGRFSRRGPPGGLAFAPASCRRPTRPLRSPAIEPQPPRVASSRRGLRSLHSPQSVSGAVAAGARALFPHLFWLP